MEGKKLIKYILIIIIVLVVVFLSQQAYSGRFGKTLVSDAANQAGAYLAKGSSWVISTIYPKISDQVQNGGFAIKNGLTKTENYFSGIANSVLHPGQNNNCQVQPPQTPAAK
jgi:hypothetical protein